MHVTDHRTRARDGARALFAAALAFTAASAPAPARAGVAEPEAPPAATEPAPAPPPESADAAKADCLANYEAAQLARRERRLLDSRAALRICSGVACPAAVRADCVDWLDQVAHSLPSVVVTARARGADVLAVKVFIDDKLATERLTGFALEIDPGLRKFRFESPPWPVIEREVLASEGVKDRRIEVEFAPPLPTAPTVTEASAPPPFRLGRSDYVFGGIALAGFATLGYFGGTGLYDAHHLQTTCHSYCNRDDVQAVSTKLVIADIGLAVGLLALAVGLYLHGKAAF
jgi:hypothetical protein